MRVVVAILIVVGALWRVYQRERARQPAPEGPTRQAPAPRGERTAPQREPSVAEADDILLGNPTDAIADSANADNFLVKHLKFVLSYNSSRGGPNWVSWHLQRSDLGNVERSNNFMPDSELLPAWQIRPSDYLGSGYDRGHMCPSGDRTASEAANRETFVMSNMLPQTGDLNRHVWEGLESYCRELVTKEKKELYVVAGGRDKADTIAHEKVAVPSFCWKVIVVLPEGDDDLQRINADTPVIAVDIPNRQGIANDSWRNYLTTVRKIEDKASTRRLKLNLLSELHSDVAAVLETRKDAGEGTEMRTSSDESRSRRRRSSR